MTPHAAAAWRDRCAVLALALALRLVGAWSIPLWRAAATFVCAPDEQGHFEATAALVAGGTRTWPEAASIYTVYPPSQYAAQALALRALSASRVARWLQRTEPAEERFAGYGAARLGSVALGAATVLLLMAAAARATGSRDAALAVGLAAAAYPQLVFISAYVNGDAMTLAAGALLVWALAAWAQRGEGASGLLAVGLASGAVLLGKPYAFAALPPAAGWIAWALVRRRTGFAAVLAAGLVAVAVAAPVLAWNAARNGGDALGLVKYGAFISGAGIGHPGAASLGALAVFARATAISSFAKLGNMSIALPIALYVPWGVLALCGAATLVRLAARGTGASARGARALLASAAIGLALLAYNSWRVDFQPQGRYVLLPAFLITALPLAAPPARFAPPAVRTWRVAWVAFVVAAGLWTVGILYVNPCGD